MFNFTLTPEIQSRIVRLDALRARLDAGVTLSRRWAGRLRRELEVGAIAASTSMEGVAVTADDVRRILVGDRPRSVTPEDSQLVEGYRDAMSYVLRRADDPSFSWQSELIRAIHDKVLAGSYSHGAGRYRTGPVYVTAHADGSVRYTPPPAGQVPKLVEEALDLASASEQQAPVTAALLHVAIAAVHPFSDGNGRTARILASLAMYRGGYRRPEFTSLEEWWGAHPDEYYGAFEVLGDSWTSRADVTAFVECHLGAQVAQVEEYEVRLAAERDLWVALENISEDVGDARGVEALYDAYVGRAVTNRYYREIAQVSSVTAATDLARLQAAGLLRSTGAGSTTEFVATQQLMARVAAEFGLSDGLPASAPVEEQRAWITATLRWRVQERC